MGLRRISELRLATGARPRTRVRLPTVLVLVTLEEPVALRFWGRVFSEPSSWVVESRALLLLLATLEEPVAFRLWGRVFSVSSFWVVEWRALFCGVTVFPVSCCSPALISL